MNFKVFYTNYEWGDEVSSNDPIALDREEILLTARKILLNEGDFLGIVDNNNLTLQFMVEADEMLHLDIPVPSEKGSYTRKISMAELADEIGRLAQPFSLTEMKGLIFEAW